MADFQGCTMQANPIILPIPWWPSVIVLFTTAWCLVCFLISRFGGWWSLSKRFRAPTEPYGDTRTAGPFFYVVYMRWLTHYSCVIRMAAAEDALYLSVLFPFRPGHPPLRIPWSEIEIAMTTRWWVPYVVLTLGREERIWMRISPRMARKLGILDRVTASPPTSS